ncbi:MAG: hypothetical protein QXG73_03045 [Candidatus Micrarchaeaceae archaeon]
MKREVYLWILFFALLAAAVIYFRYYYQPEISMSVKFLQPSYSVYPYQRVSMPINVSNIGSSPIRNMSIEILVNSNITSIYKVTLPPHKFAIIYYNTTFPSYGAYNITAIADAGKVYKISDRAEAQSAAAVDVIAPEALEPYTALPQGNFTSIAVLNTSSAGLLLLGYLHSNFGVDALGYGSIADYGFFTNLFNLTSSYIKNVSIARGSYANGSTATAIWLSGYLSPSIIGVAAQSAGINATSATVNGQNATYVKLQNGTSLCSWYSGGLLKILITEPFSCLGYVGVNNTANEFGAERATANFYASKLMGEFNNALFSKLAAYVSLRNNSFKVGAFELNSSAFYVPVLSTYSGNSKTLSCLGLINSINGTHYCSTDILPKNGTIGSISLVRTMMLGGGINSTVFMLANTSKIILFVPRVVEMINDFGVTNSSVAFVSAIGSSCSIGNGFGCSAPNFLNGSISFSIKNTPNATRITSLGCYMYIPGALTTANITLGPNATANLTAKCYNGGALVNGIPLNLDLNLIMNYTQDNVTHTAFGKAYINAVINATNSG